VNPVIMRAYSCWHRVRITVKYTDIMFLWQHDGSDTPGVIQLLLLL